MGLKITKHSSQRAVTRSHRKQRFWTKLKKSRSRVPRLVVFRSNQFLYAQVIDDQKGLTIAQANTHEKEFEKLGSRKNLAAATALGKLIGTRTKDKQIVKIVFDRNGYDYHGRIKAIADGAREAGLGF